MSTRLFALSGKRALVTGSTRGLGFEIARGLGEAGAELILNGRTPDRLKEAVASLAGRGLSVTGTVFDVNHYSLIETAIADIEEDQGPIDILVNNAGIQIRHPLEEFDLADWQKVIDTNLTGVYQVGRAVVRGMIERQAGKIINICSLMSEVARPTIGAYTVAKGGVKMLTRSMATEWAKHNIQINGIGPGYFETDMTRPLVADPEFNNWIRKRTPAGRWGKPAELIGTAVYLASSASNFVNGQIIYVDGGMLATL